MKKILLIILSIILTSCKSGIEYTRENRLVEHNYSELVQIISSKPKEENPLREEYSCRFISSYNYSKPVPSSEEAGEEYFKNTIMGGDSRMGSLALYSELPDLGAEIYYVTSLSIWRVYDMNINDEVNKSLFDIFKDTEKKNIYFIIGINEINGMNMDVWEEELNNFVVEVKKSNIDANIYLIQGYYPRELNNMSLEDLKAAVEEENNRIKNIARKNKVFFLNPNDSSLLSEDGILKEDLTWDGVHLSVDGAKILADYIKTHVYMEDRYVKEICE